MGEKRILIDLLNLAEPQIAGVGYFTRNLLSRWLAQKELPYQVVCYSSSAIKAEEVFGFQTTSKIKVVRVNIKHVISRLFFQQFILPFILMKYDGYYNPAVGLPFLARVISPKTKLIVTIHDMTPFFFSRKYSRRRSILVKALSKFASKAAHAIVTVSQNSKNDIICVSNVPADKITVVYNFMPHAYDLSNAEDEKYFLCISTIEPGKNVENTIKGFAKFREDPRFHNYKFYWMGRVGWVYSDEDVAKFAHDLNVQDSFIRLGYLTEEEKASWVRKCTAIVYMSYYEGFGLPVLEGLYHNKPSVVSNVSSLPEVVGKTGVQCGPDDVVGIAEALKTVISQRKKFVMEIPEQIKKFDPDVQIETFDRTLRKVVGV